MSRLVVVIPARFRDARGWGTVLLSDRDHRNPRLKDTPSCFSAAQSAT